MSEQLAVRHSQDLIMHALSLRVVSLETACTRSLFKMPGVEFCNCYTNYLPLVPYPTPFL